MAYDGIYIRSQIKYYEDNLIGEHIHKITQNNIKEYDFHVHKNKRDFILTLSCDPVFPYILFSNDAKSNLDTPLSFCMLLRKYIESGKIIGIKQINGKDNNDTLERIIDISITNLSDSGDINTYHLLIELMGKYSNIILCDSEYIIIDLVNKVENNISDRKLLPKTKYETITISNKVEFLNISYDDYIKYIKNTITKLQINNEKINICDIFVNTFLGFSKNYINNLIKKYNLSNNIDNKSFDILYKVINGDINNINTNNTKCYIYYNDDKIKDFHNIYYNNYEKYDEYNDTESCLKAYINNKYKENIKSFDKTSISEKIEHIIKKYIKKIDINESDLNKCKDMDKYKLYGDLISSFGYDKNLIKNDVLVCENYYDGNKLIEIPIDTTISIQNNIKKYYDKYNKLKRTYAKVNELYTENKNKLEHILSIKDSLNINDSKIDINNIKDELNQYFLYTNKEKSSKNKKKNNIILHHYVTSNNIDVYIGKNNIQNEYLSFNFADKFDTWFHIKNDTGSHVILKNKYENCDMKDIEEAASLAAYFSNKKNEKKVEVDYTYVKELKKVKGKVPGFCIYHKNYSIIVAPKLLKEVKY